VIDIIALDWGEKDYGLALGSSETGLILPYSEQIRSGQIFDVLYNRIVKNQIRLIILGKPHNFRGKEIQNSQKIDNLVRRLEALFPNVRIQTWDERNTSKDAEKSLKGLGNNNKKVVHHLAAMKILERYFESNKG
jgi:putative transcription antitermination factor YqgF